jgi:hypothetical protein
VAEEEGEAVLVVAEVAAAEAVVAEAAVAEAVLAVAEVVVAAAEVDTRNCGDCFAALATTPHEITRSSQT